MRRWRVGTVSMGLLLVAIGILLLISEIQGYNAARLILRWWPVILIILGVEILAYVGFSKDEQPKIKFDGFSIFLAIFIILISSGVYGVTSFFNNDFPQGFSIGFNKNETIINKTYEINASQVKKLQIDNSAGQINVENYDGSKIKIDAVLSFKNTNEEKAADLADSVVKITEGETLLINTRKASLIDSNEDFQVTVNYTVKVPKEMSFEINNQFGEINLKGLVGNTKVNGKFGKIDVENIQGDVQINNSFGQTLVKDVQGKLEITNENGEISYSSQQEATKDISLKCKMGAVTLELPSSQQGAFKVITKLGDIRSEGFKSDLVLKKNDTSQQLEGTIGKASPSIFVETELGSASLIGK